jgi:hypothetical protein
MTKYLFIGLSLMWMTVFYQNCSPNVVTATHHQKKQKQAHLPVQAPIAQSPDAQ